MKMGKIHRQGNDEIKTARSPDEGGLRKYVGQAPPKSHEYKKGRKSITFRLARFCYCTANLNKSSFSPTWCLFLGLVCLVVLAFTTTILENILAHFFPTALLYENNRTLTTCG